MNDALALLAAERILVTGASGSIGTRLVDRLLWSQPAAVLATDVGSMDVTDRSEVHMAFYDYQPTLVFHLAGAKHAPQGEEDPAEAAELNIVGTRNVLDYAAKHDARVVTASTCKACNPETAYGATKLIAERLTLNAGGSVARFFNVRESSGNVFELWRDLAPTAPVPVTPCKRRFMSIDDAVRLLVWTANLPAGRYTVTGTKLESMSRVAHNLYPDRALVHIPPRRGDRLEEPALATQETSAHAYLGIARIISPHDQQPALEQVAA